MIVTNPEYEEIVSDVKREYEEGPDDPESSFYVEQATGYIYEVKLFPDFALVRPATPEASANIMRTPLLEFAEHFYEYLGDAQAIRDYLWGSDIPEKIVVDRK